MGPGVGGDCCGPAVGRFPVVPSRYRKSSAGMCFPTVSFSDRRFWSLSFRRSATRGAEKAVRYISVFCARVHLLAVEVASLEPVSKDIPLSAA